MVPGAPAPLLSWVGKPGKVQGAGEGGTQVGQTEHGRGERKEETLRSAELQGTGEGRGALRGQRREPALAKAPRHPLSPQELGANVAYGPACSSRV